MAYPTNKEKKCVESYDWWNTQNETQDFYLKKQVSFSMLLYTFFFCSKHAYRYEEYQVH